MIEDTARTNTEEAEALRTAAEMQGYLNVAAVPYLLEAIYYQNKEIIALLKSQNA